MIKYLSAFVAIFFIWPAFADAPKVSRLKSESDGAFVSRITHHPVIDKQLSWTKKLIAGKDSLVAFTESDAPDPTNPSDHNLVLNVFTPEGKNGYRWYQQSACEIEGGEATLRSFFFARASTRPELDIAVICGWDDSHQGADCDSNDVVRFFRVSAENEGKIEEITDKKFDAFYRQKKPSKESDIECTYSNFSNAADVKRLLEKLGFRQDLK